MKKELEKLSLTKDQYFTLGILMLVFSIVLGVVSFFVAGLSAGMGIVLIFVAAEMGFLGYWFCRLSSELSNSSDPDRLKNHEPSVKAKKNYCAFSVFLAVVFIACAASSVLTITLSSSPSDSDNQALFQTYQTQQSSQTLEQTSKTADNITVPPVVYATENGKRYHYSASCAGENCFAITIEEAQRHLLTPCLNCASK
ncbi:MAG: hypothetical protein IJS17_00895 [Clostridia bacterium]|nr:hypothetical protein [Clostridia bacterium]